MDELEDRLKGFLAKLLKWGAIIVVAVWIFRDPVPAFETIGGFFSGLFDLADKGADTLDRVTNQ